jgi:hypothetical protein
VPKVSSSMPLSAFNPVGSWSDISGSMRSNGCEVWKCDRGIMRVWVERRMKFLSCEDREERNSDMKKASLRAKEGLYAQCGQAHVESYLFLSGIA